MLAISATLVLFDMTDRALVLVSLESGHVLHRFRLDDAMRPLALLTHGRRVYLIANSRVSGALYTLSDDLRRLVRFDSTLPVADHACILPNGSALFLSGKRHIWQFDLMNAKLTAPIATDTPARLAANQNVLYAARTNSDGTLLSSYRSDGTLIDEHLLSGIVTTFHFQDDIGYLPFTQSPLHGEGLYLLDLTEIPTSVKTVSITPQTTRALSAYPYSVLVQHGIIYLVCEEAAAIARIDAHTHQILDRIPLGRSITNLYPLPDTRFALATSNMFADLLLIDLINARLLTLSICPHELFYQLAVLPQ